jgi:predicted nuclease with TOPRIM domain
LLQHPAKELKRLETELQRYSYYKVLAQQRNDLEEKLKNLQKARNRIKDAFRDGTYTNFELKEELNLVDEDKAVLSEELEAVNAQLVAEQAKAEKNHCTGRVAKTLLWKAKTSQL